MSIRTAALLFALVLAGAGTGNAAGVSFDSVFAATPPWGATPSRINSLYERMLRFWKANL